MTTEEENNETINRRSLIDKSCRFPVLFFIVSASAWLIFAATLGFIQQMKMHAPQFIDFSWLYFLNYGRSNPAFMTALVYGWAIQAGLGIGIWIMARLCSAEIKNPLTLLVAGHFWNIGVSIGVFGILLGYGTSIEWMAFPKAVWPILFASFSMIVIWLVMMFFRRQDRNVYISVWYILGSCFWFTWIFLTSNMYIHVFPGSALAKASTNAWYLSSLIYLFFVPLGLGVAYYLIPKIMGRPVHSSQLSYYGFWGLAVFGGWTGIQKFMGGPFPSWMPAVSGAAVIFMLIPILIVTVNQLMTIREDPSLINHSPALKFTAVGIGFFIVFSILYALGSFLSVGRFTQISFTSSGYQLLAVYGFFSMVMFGAIYFIVPRLMETEWPSANGIKSHLVLSVYAILILGVVHLFGGIWQSSAYAKFDSPLENAIAAAKPYAIGASLGWIAILVSTTRFIINLFCLIFKTGQREIFPTLIAATRISPNK